MGDRDKIESLLTRRSFVGLVGKGAMVVALGGFIRIFDWEGNIPRPPGALPEPEFLATCIRCDICRNVCPDGYITPVAITESLVSVGSPRLAGYYHGVCPRCRRCIYACPTGALRIDR